MIDHERHGELPKHLVTNAVVLWNTLYLQAALDQIRQEGGTVNPDDVTRLSPLQHAHINVLGRYPFTLLESVSQGTLRPLHFGDETVGFPLE